MKIRQGFMLREVAGQWIVVPLGERTVEFSAILSLSESGANLWKRLEKEALEGDLVKDLCETYEVDEVEATQDVKAFLSDLSENGLIE